ncbi:MAG: hypothetical protein KBT33_02755 [Prevotellaceae bacterium]|nr:hypothetical protein [Candidatus Minthosoma equi]
MRLFNFRMPMESERRHKPLDLLINFFVREGIKYDDDLAGYKEVEVCFGDDGTPLYHVERAEETKRSSVHFSSVRYTITSVGRTWILI